MMPALIIAHWKKGAWDSYSCPSRIFVLVDILDEILKQCQPEILVIADVGEDPGS